MGTLGGMWCCSGRPEQHARAAEAADPHIAAAKALEGAETKADVEAILDAAPDGAASAPLPEGVLQVGAKRIEGDRVVVRLGLAQASARLPGSAPHAGRGRNRSRNRAMECLGVSSGADDALPAGAPSHAPLRAPLTRSRPEPRARAVRSTRRTASRPPRSCSPSAFF